jgi:hypothetical protein
MPCIGCAANCSGQRLLLQLPALFRATERCLGKKAIQQLGMQTCSAAACRMELAQCLTKSSNLLQDSCRQPYDCATEQQAWLAGVLTRQQRCRRNSSAYQQAVSSIACAAVMNVSVLLGACKQVKQIQPATHATAVCCACRL